MSNGKCLYYGWASLVFIHVLVWGVHVYFCWVFVCVCESWLMLSLINEVMFIIWAICMCGIKSFSFGVCVCIKRSDWEEREKEGGFIAIHLLLISQRKGKSADFNLCVHQPIQGNTKSTHIQWLMYLVCVKGGSSGLQHQPHSSFSFSLSKHTTRFF